MKVKEYKGYNDTRFIEVLEPLTLEDFIIEETAPHFLEYNKSISGKLVFHLQEEVAENIKPLLERKRKYSKDDEDEVFTSWAKHFERKVSFQGCKTDESKEKKIEEVRQREVVAMCDKKADRMTSLLSEINRELENRLEDINNKYTEEVTKVMDGSNMSKEFIAENLDDTIINASIKQKEDELKSLREELTELEAEQQEIRNENMLKYIEKEGWSDEDDNSKVVIAPSLREKLEEMYKNGEAFSKSKNRGLFIH